MIWYTWIWWFW